MTNSVPPEHAVFVSPPSRRRRRVMLAVAVLGSLVLHLMVTVPLLVPGILFAAKAPPPEPIPVEIVSLPPKPEEAKPPTPAEPPPPQQAPEPPPKPVQLPPPQPPPPVTPQQIVVATRAEATPPQGDEKPNAAEEKPEPEAKPQPMPPPKPQAKPEPPKPAPPKPEPPKEVAARPEPPPEREVTGAIALGRPAAKAPDQITAADHKMPPVVVRPLPPGRRGNSLMPSYPSAARANGLQGRVVLLVTLSEEGRPRRIDIARSSGHDQLDESAVRAVWLWRFYRTDNGPPMEATIEIPLDFRL